MGKNEKNTGHKNIIECRHNNRILCATPWRYCPDCDRAASETAEEYLTRLGRETIEEDEG